MKRLVLCLFVVAVSLFADASGIWQGTGVLQDPKYGPHGSPLQLTLTQAGTSLTGSFRMANGSVNKIQGGKVNGSQITFFVGGPGGVGQANAQLTQSGSQITGRMTISTGAVYTISLSKH